MNRTVRILMITVWCIAAWVIPGTTRATETVPLTILHMNDLHGHILPYEDKTVRQDKLVSGAGYFAAIIRQERSRQPDSTLLLAAGDMFQGTPISNVFKGEPVMEIMNALQFDAMAIGNHEFDWGRGPLDQLMAAARFPFLAANIVTSTGQGLQGTKPCILVKRKGLQVAVIGLTTPETAYSTKPAHVADLTFQEPASVMPGLVRKVRSEGAGLVVVLSHLGLDADLELARKVSGIDVIFGGHSHTAVTDPVRINGTIIVQAGYYGLYVGALDLEVDPGTQKIVRYTTRDVLRPVVADDQAPSDATITSIANRYDSEIKAEFSRVVGKSDVDLLRQPMAESNVGNLIADAMREASGADIAFQNGGGIRADLSAGDITLEELYTLLPFDNQLVAMTLRGDQVLQLLEASGDQHTKILQVSGLAVEYDSTRPAGSRVARASVKGETLRPDAAYRVATNDFLAAGGDNFTTFKEGTDLAYGDTLRDTVSDYLQKHSPVRPAVENRIRFGN